MQDKELFQQIVCPPSPWAVRDGNLDTENQEIRIQVDQPRGTKFCCPERQWRHLDCGQFKTILVSRVPRVACPKGGVRSVSVPWAEPHSRFILFFERFAIEVLQMTQTDEGR